MRQDVDATEIVRGLKALFGRFAVAHQDIQAKSAPYVDFRRVGPSEVQFRFMTEDRFLMQPTVDLQDIFTNPDAIEGVIEDVLATLSDARRRRRNARITIQTAPSQEVH